MYEETYNDLYIKHAETFVTLDVHGNRELAYIYSFDADGYDITVSYGILDEAREKLQDMNAYWEEIGDRFILEYPVLGARNIGKGVLFLRRKLQVESPYSYRKSFTMHSLKSTDPNMMERKFYNELTFQGVISQSKRIRLCSDIFSYSGYSSEQALLSILEGKRFGTSFSPNYYYTFNVTNNAIYLWRDTNILGHFDFNKEHFILTSDIFKSDLKQLNVRLEA